MPRASRSSSPGLGVDIVEIDRLERLARKTPRFLRRVFSPSEIRYCESKRLKWQHYAVRFAAKEAVWKCLGLSGLALSSIEVRHDAGGRPQAWLRGRRAGGLALSLSHSERYAVAVAWRGR